MLINFLYYLGIYLIFVLLSLPLIFLIAVLCNEKGRRSFVLAVRSLWLHKLRAFLSILGIIIGTAAVIILMGYGKGTMEAALEAIERQGATNIMVSSVKLPSDSSTGRRTRVATYGIKYRDYQRFLTMPTVVRSIPTRFFRQEIRFEDRLVSGRLVATNPGYAEVNKLRCREGRFFTDDESYAMLNRVVLGAGLARKLFPYSSPLGQSISVGRFLDKYLVVGVLESRQPSTGNDSEGTKDFNNDIYIPLNTCMHWYGERIIDRQSGSWSAEAVELHEVILTVATRDQVRPTGEGIRDMLSTGHKRPDWKVDVPLDKLQQAEEERDRFLVFLAFIGSISLAVGGIGIMNIMLASVTERTREIGIRRALGAKRRDITLQFLVEAIVQTGLGGIIGVAIGLLFILVVAIFGGPAQVQQMSIFISLAVSLLVGIGFGWYPARRAALLDPIEALRHE